MHRALLATMMAISVTNAARPNFVYVLCDDMNELLGDEAVVPQIRSLIAEQGARASNAFVSSPKCTPSRSAWLSGRYYHNLRPNGATSGRGLNTTHFFDRDALFPTLHRNGYQTALFGKIHNNQASWLCKADNHTEPFTHIETECSPCGNYMPKDFVTKQEDERYTAMETLAADDPRTHYSHAQYGNRSAAWIKAAAAKEKPFFAFVGTTGPHLPATPAPWHADLVDANPWNITAPRTPNFNELAADHFDLLATHAPLSDAVVADIDKLMRQRWAVLMSIDDLVAGLVDAVTEAGAIDNTYFLFSSDHGYHLGQHRIPIEKMLPYETDIRIPLFIKGPGIKPGTALQQIVANIDIAPTVLDLAGLPVPTLMDGQSMAPLLLGKPVPTPGWRTRFASEFAEGGVQTYGPFPIYDNPDNQWRMLRVINDTHNIAYIEWDKEYVFDKIDFAELYDIGADPWQRKNLINGTAAHTRAALHAELVDMFTCAGTRAEVSSCHLRSSSPLPPPSPTPAPVPPSPPPPPAPAPTCDALPHDTVLNETNIKGGDIIRPCPLVNFPGTYSGALQCKANCDSSAQCVGWTFHHNGRDAQWRCCVKSTYGKGCSRANGMWSGLKK